MSAAVGEGGSEDRTSHAGVEWMEHHQVALYIAALAFGAVVGLVWPQVAAPAGLMITPVLALLLYATFLGFRSTGSGGRSRTGGSSPPSSR